MSSQAGFPFKEGESPAESVGPVHDQSFRLLRYLSVPSLLVMLVLAVAIGVAALRFARESNSA